MVPGLANYEERFGTRVCCWWEGVVRGAKFGSDGLPGGVRI